MKHTHERQTQLQPALKAAAHALRLLREAHRLAGLQRDHTSEIVVNMMLAYRSLDEAKKAIVPFVAESDPDRCATPDMMMRELAR